MVAKKDEKTSLGSKTLNYVPWRIALTAAAFAIPVAGPIVGTAVGALAYGIALLIIIQTDHKKAESTA